MSSRRSIVAFPIFMMAILVIVTTSNQSHAQIAAAGVDVDAKGVLRTKALTDPTGALTRKRLAEAKAILNKDVARISGLRKISINRLEAAIQAQRDAGQQLTEDMMYLAGLTRLSHVFFYPETGDIVIAGPAEGYGFDISERAVGIVTGRSILQLEDLITALRAFPPTGDEVGLVSVSIDPTSDGLAKMAQFLKDLKGVRPEHDTRIAKGLREHMGLQTVTVRGISPKSHMAQVLVEADYRMKLIGIGLEVPPVKITNYVDRASARQVASNALQRWYFTPNYECVRVSKDQLAMQLVGDGVKLIGADERVTAAGGRVSVKKTNKASEGFVQEFTEKYPELADKVPVYGQLRNMIDLLVSAAFIRDRDYYAQADWDMSLLMDEELISVEYLEAPKHVETAVNVVWKGSTLVTPVGGGVNIQPRKALARELLLKDENGKLSDSREASKIKALPKNQWWWD